MRKLVAAGSFPSEVVDDDHHARQIVQELLEKHAEATPGRKPKKVRKIGKKLLWISQLVA